MMMRTPWESEVERASVLKAKLFPIVLALRTLTISAFPSHGVLKASAESLPKNFDK